jgi:hypothetical protein
MTMAQERQFDNPIDVAEGRLTSKDGGRCTHANPSLTGNELDGTHHDARGLTTEITLFEKFGGILSKRISLGADGKPVSDGDACEMWDGWAKRRTIGDQRRAQGRRRGPSRRLPCAGRAGRARPPPAPTDAWVDPRPPA